MIILIKNKRSIFACFFVRLLYCSVVVLILPHGFHNCFKYFGFVFREIGQNLAVQLDFLFLQRIHETAVGESERTDGGVDFDVPQTAVGSFFVFAVTVGVGAGFGNRDFRKLDAIFASPAVALSLRENLAPFFLHALFLVLL